MPQLRGDDAKTSKKLAFKEKLLTKGQSTDAILKKLKALHVELADFDQEQVDKRSLTAVRKDLINVTLFMHKDKGVKAYTACCLADILRLYAPDAPYEAAELRDIFQFFFKQLSSGLKGTDSPYYNEYFHLVESLSTVKTTVLACSLPDCDELVVEIFRDIFAIVRRDLPKKVELYLADILIALVDECPTIPTEVLETIMSQFMDQNARLDQPAYRTAVAVCNATADRLQRHVSQYFTDIIVNESPSSSGSSDDFNEIRTAHELIKRLHRSCPSLLHSVIPQLEEELRVEEVQLRIIATQVLGEMYGANSGHELVKNYPTTWTEWLKRRNDKSPAVRLKFVETAGSLIASFPQVKDVVEDALKSKLLDPDEKIRGAVCRTYSQLDYETALHHVSVEQLQAVTGRGLDKKHHVRHEALTAIGKLYSLAYPELESSDPTAIKHFGWIPNEIFSMLGTPEARTIVEQVVVTYILPLPSSTSTQPSTSKSANEIDESAWTERLLTVMKYLDDKGVQGLLTLSGIKQSRPTIYEHFVEACIKNNGGVIDENEDQVTRRLNSVVQFIATGFPEPHKASEDLHAFAKLNEGRLYKLLKTCMDPSTDLKGLVKTTNEFVRRMEQASPSLMNTMSSFLYRCSLRIFNQSSIPSLIKAIQRDHGKTTLQTQVHAAHSLTLMTSISKHFPILYKPHIPELSKAIASEKSEKLVEASLQALAAAARFDEKLAPLDKRTIERVSRYALGDNRRHAKFAARLLAFTKDKDSTCATVIESVVSGLDEATDDTLVARLAVLVQFARYAPESFERHSEVITTSVLQGLLMIPTPATPPDAMDVDEDPEEEWAEEDALSSVIKAKILALKMFRYRCLGHAQDEDPLEVATPVLKMLVTILDQNGSLPGGQDEDPKLLSRLRLEAATSLIHLSCIGVYLASLAPRFVRLVLTIQDTCYNVRHIFITKVVALLSSRKLPARFSVIPFMTVHDPETDVRFIASSYVSGALKRMTPALRFEHFEYIIIRLLHVLAHHPDFSTSANDLLDMAKYIQSYLDLVANADNISLINTLAAKGKTVRDPESHTHSENLYALSELAQELIKHHARQRSWGITSYPGKLKLPGDILKPLPSAEAANTVLKTVYLPEGAIDWLNDLGKPKQSGKDREKKEKSTVKRKASASKSNGHATKRSKKRKQTDDDDDDDDSSPVTEDEDDFGNPLSSKREESPLSSLGESEDEDESKGNEEDLGRGARSRAKARARRRSKHGPEKS